MPMQYLKLTKLNMRSQIGFTLIEILIAVALVAILAGIAIPSYNNYINRGKIKTAQADLIALNLNFANYYQRKLAYPENTKDLTTTDKLTTEFKGWQPASKDFDFASDKDVASKTDYKLVAKGKTGTGVAGCVVSITKDNVRKIESCSLSSTGDWL